LLYLLQQDIEINSGGMNHGNRDFQSHSSFIEVEDGIPHLEYFTAQLS
jgi:hypothetical protein